MHSLLFFHIVLGGNFIHSYGRLVHSQQVITRRDQLLPPGDVRGPGKMECTRTRQRVYFALKKRGIGRNGGNAIFYRNVENDCERDTIQFRTSDVNRIRNTQGFCTVRGETFFYLFLLPGEFSLVRIMLFTFTCHKI